MTATDGKRRCIDPHCTGFLRADGTYAYDPYYIRPGGYCEECFLNFLVPKWYPGAELYLNGNATAKPATGIALLDMGVQPIRDIAGLARAPRGV